MSHLSKKKCLPCIKATPAVKGQELKALHEELGEAWLLINDKQLERSFTFKNFKEALAFVNKVAAIAEEEGHHPDIALSWGKVTIRLWTHAIGGLSENDFILAAKIDTLYLA
jgi:4a-hydroxytetrahydrobiopterin dehydratase